MDWIEDLDIRKAVMYDKALESLADCIMEEQKKEMAHPVLERDEILFWLKRFRELDTTKLSHRRRLIDSFVNSIILFDDRMIFTGNYKDSTKTITFAEIEAADFSSDLTASLGPKPAVSSWKLPVLT